MGIFGDILKGVGSVATKLIPGPIDDIAFQAITRATGGGGGGGASRNLFQRVSQGQAFPTSGSITTQARDLLPPQLRPVGMQERPKLPDINIGGGVSINPPGGGSPGAGISFGAGINQGQPTTPSGRTRASGGTLPMMGRFGVQPDVEDVPTRRCPTGHVLAIDGLCYPKQMVPKSLRFWKPSVKPPITRADQKAIQRADRAKKKLVNLTKKAGAHASMTRPRSRRK